MKRNGPVGIFDQVAEGLAHVHRSGLVHRDIKPSNILVADLGEDSEYALLSDFGIARALDSSTGLTRGLIGTAEYIAPEIVQWDPAGPASDQYSLACVLFEMLVGASPYRGKDLPRAHVTEPVPDIRVHAPGMSNDLSFALAKGMAKSPDERYGSVGLFATAVRTANASQASTNVGSSGDPLDGREVVPPDSQVGELRTIADFRRMKNDGCGIVVITDPTRTPARAHLPGCPYVREDYFTTKVVNGRGRNGRYFLTPALSTALKEFGATPCPICSPT